MPACTIVILTYKGKHHLEYLLPTVKEAIDNYRGKAEIDVLIVDNGCDDATRQYALDHFPQFRYEFSPVNDYLFSLNSYVQALSSEYMLLLNDDMRLDKEILNELIPLITSDNALFAISCNVIDWDGINPTHGVRELIRVKGLLTHHWKNYSFDMGKLYYTLYPAGGAAIFHIARFNQLGGFDPLFRPAYNEDADLGVNAWYKGWPTIFSPRAIIYHREGGTINEQFKMNKLSGLQVKNTLKWSLKNNLAAFSQTAFFLMLPYRLIYNFFFNRTFAIALLAALADLPEIRKKRIKFKPTISTTELEQLLKDKFIYNGR